MNIESFLKEKCWGESFFEPERLGNETSLYTTTSTFYIHDLINGRKAPAWSASPGQSYAESLFEKLKPFVEELGACWVYIADHDFAWSQIERIDEIDHHDFNPYMLTLFQTAPAMEGGSASLALVFKREESMVVFHHGPTRFTIRAYGHQDTVTRISNTLNIFPKHADNETNVRLELTGDEALVLSEFLQRFSNTDSLKLEHQSEQRALWNLCCLLERSLVEPFMPNYDKLLEAARERLRDKT